MNLEPRTWTSNWFVLRPQTGRRPARRPQAGVTPAATTAQAALPPSPSLLHPAVLAEFASPKVPPKLDAR